MKVRVEYPSDLFLLNVDAKLSSNVEPNVSTSYANVLNVPATPPAALYEDEAVAVSKEGENVGENVDVENVVANVVLILPPASCPCPSAWEGWDAESFSLPPSVRAPLLFKLKNYE